MKKPNTLITTAMAAIVSVLASGAIAKGPMNLSDLDGDGVISAEEIQTQVDAQRTEKMALFDTDGDGELSDTEKQAMRETRKAERLATTDTDGDGEVSRAERRAAREAKRDAIEAQLDVDGDGVVSDAEGAGFDQFREESREERGKGHGRKGRGDSHQDDSDAV